MEHKNQDTLYAKPQSDISDFVFDKEVANVFDDMIKRSVPGYAAIINMIGVLAQQYVQANSVCYDLGCSLGAGTLAMRRGISKENVEIIAVDNSPSMVEKCREHIEKDNSSTRVNIVCDDIRNIRIEKASMVILNFTLQFIDPQKRGALLKEIYDGMYPGAILVISDKIAFEDKREEAFQTELHHTFKKQNGYSDLEISQKRTALENVLIPDTLQEHQDRLKAIGFTRSLVWFQCFNFASLIAFKS